MKNWTERHYLGAVAVTMVAWLGFNVPWTEWTQTCVLRYTASLTILAAGWLLPLRWGVAITVGFATALMFLSGGYVAMLTAQRGTAQQTDDDRRP
jgi:ABC-type branched-subunit amino acid transport system permease subunit